MEEIRKKIVFTVINDLTYDQRMIRICGTLAANGYEVELVGRMLPSSVPTDNKAYKQTRLNCWFHKGKLFYIEYTIRLFFYLLFVKADIFSSVDLDTLLSCTLVAKIKSRKLVFDAHEYFTEVPEVTERKWVKRIWNAVARVCVPHAHKAYTVSQSLAEIFQLEYRKAFEVIRNVPYLAAPQPANRSINKIILYQGSLNEGRGLQQAIMAMHQVDAVLWLAGEGDLSAELKETVEREKLSGKVRFLGYLKPEELKQVTLQATIGLNMLENKGLSYYYSLANKFFDYIQAEVPQVCVNFPEYEAINRQQEVAVLCRCETGEIAAAINKLLHDASFYERLRSSCSHAKMIFNWEQESQKLINLYQSL